MIKSGCQLILEERLRQEGVEGFTAKHDDTHEEKELAMAASSYLGHYLFGVLSLNLWPFHISWWKPTTDIHNLTKAGALIAAEIDRLQRKEA